MSNRLKIKITCSRTKYKWMAGYCVSVTLTVKQNLIANLCSREYLEQYVSLPDKGQSAVSLVFHVPPASPGTAILTKNKVPTFRVSDLATKQIQ